VGERSGPTLIVVAAIHGNEQAGIHAARRVLDRLRDSEIALRGELVVFAGNVAAMREGRRYVVRDLNRMWTDEAVAELESRQVRAGVLEAHAAGLDSEQREQLELLNVIRGAIARAKSDVYLVDLHTTSAHGVPFALFGDTPSQRAFVSALPIPIIMGLEEQLDGVLSAYWTRHGCVTFGVEGGQHHDPGSVDNLEAVLLLAAQSIGLFQAGALPETQRAYALLEERRGELPRWMEVIRRHALSADHAFVMEPGFRNLDYARANQLLACDRSGEIRAECDGIVMLPLYQPQGNDGFFWGRAVSPMRLRVSEALRAMRADRWLALLPGVKRDAQRPGRLVVEAPAAARYKDAFSMLGYRRMREHDACVIVEKIIDCHVEGR